MSITFGGGIFGGGAFGGGTAVSGAASPAAAARAKGFAATLALAADDDVEFPMRVAKADEATGIKLRSRCRFFENEWFADLRLGVPYFRIIYRKGTTLATMKQIFRRIILSVPQIASIDSLAITIDKQARKAFIDAQAFSDDGRTITISEEPFIL